MSKNTAWKLSFEKLEKALSRLGNCLEQSLDKDDYILDATIQRFEFTTELFWKTLKHLLRLKGSEHSLPREILQEAYAAGWLEDEKVWLGMMKDRNLTSHTYNHDQALEIYSHIKDYYPQMQKAFKHLQENVIPKL